MLTKPSPSVMDDPLHPLSQGCVCHLLMNEGAGSLAYDVSGHGNHGALKSMSPNAQGSGWGGSKFGGGLGFDGSNDYVDCGSDASLDITGALTIETWVKTSFTGVQSPNYLGIVTKGEYDDANADYAFGIRALATSQLYLYWKAGGTYYGASIVHSGLDDQRWHHIAGVRNSSYDLELFVDGISIGTNTNNIAPVDGGLSAKIGKGKYFFNGMTDGVRIYNRELSVEEIKQLYHDPFCNSLQVPAWQLYSPVVGLSIPVAMHYYETLRA